MAASEQANLTKNYAKVPELQVHESHSLSLFKNMTCFLFFAKIM